MKYWLPIIFVLMGGLVTACASSQLTSTSLPEATLTPKRIFAYPVCEIEPPAYQEGNPIPDDKARIWMDIGTDIADDTLAIFVGEEEVYRCFNVLIDEAIAAGHLFVLDVPPGPLQIRFVNVTAGTEEVVEFVVEQELFVFAVSYMDESNNTKYWHVRVTDEAPTYE